MSDFPPIAEYAFLSDCENSCPVAPDGSVEWLSLPRPDSPSVFGALLDRTAGSFRFGPSNTIVPHQRRYVPGTMVVETTWHTPTGWLLVQDLFVIRQVDGGPRRPDYRRAPTGSAAAGVLLRTARCISGKVEIEASCVPLFEYGANIGQWAYDGEGYDSLSVQAPDGALALSLESSLQLGIAGARCYGRTSLSEGRTPSSPSRGEDRPRRARTRPRPTWPRPCSSGVTGWPPGLFPTTRGVRTSSAAP